MSGAKTKSGFQRLVAFLSGLVLLACAAGLGYLAFAHNHILFGLGAFVVGCATIAAFETAST